MAYAEALAASGVPAEQLQARGHIHSSFTMVDVIADRRQRPRDDGASPAALRGLEEPPEGTQGAAARACAGTQWWAPRDADRRWALAEFGSAVDALRAAIAFQQAVEQANAALPKGQCIMFWVGLHVGDLIVDGDDLYGDGVNVAARLEGGGERRFCHSAQALQHERPAQCAA